MKEDFLRKKLQEREAQDAYRRLRLPVNKIDFCSNDYLGIVKNNLLEHTTGRYRYGSTGSRLLAGNSVLAEETESMLAAFHEAPAGLLFNSGYDANLGLLSCVPQRGDTILYDQLSHASIRDGIRLSFAQSFSFVHNDLEDLKKKLAALPAGAGGNIFVVTESVFSMDGDMAPLKEMAAICGQFNAHLIIDEAHAIGIVGEKGEGLCQHLGIQQQCFARVYTFGKAVGCHGAFIAGSLLLRDYLINFCRSFIYSTALPETAIDIIRKSYALFPSLHHERKHIQELIGLLQHANIKWTLLPSQTPIQGMVVPGNTQVKAIAALLQDNNIDARPILYPTVEKGKERIRIIVHAFNTVAEMQLLVRLIS